MCYNIDNEREVIIMTIRELYEAAVEQGAEDYVLADMEYGNLELCDFSFNDDCQQVQF